jgi:hypothetical protein
MLSVGYPPGGASIGIIELGAKTRKIYDSKGVKTQNLDR